MSGAFEGPVWWEEGKEDDSEARARHLFNHARDLEDRHREAHENNLLYAQMYSNRELPSFDWGYGVQYEPSLSPISRLSENLALSVVDTFTSRIGKNRPKPTVVLRDAPYSLRRAGKKLDRWVNANFAAHDVYEKGKMAFRDAAVFGFGALRVDVTGGRLAVQRVFPDDVLIDQRECVGDQAPLHLMIRRPMTVATAASAFGLEEDEVRKSAERRYLGYRGVGPEHVVVIEAFRRGVRKASGGIVPGRRVLAIDGRVIEEEKWDEEWFPFVFFQWQKPQSGWYCPSAVEQVFPYQIRLNEINDVIREAQDLMARPRVLIPEGSRINVNQIDNVIGKIIRYTGPLKPEALVWPAVSGELYGERDRLVRACYEFLGISQMSAQSKTPQAMRFDSSAAVREVNEIEDGRHAELAQRYELMYLDVAEMLVRVAQRYPAGEDGFSSVWWIGGRNARAETVSLNDIDLDRDKYVLCLEPSSILNQTPAGRKDELNRMLANGEITPAQYQQHLANPDLEGLASLAAAAAEDTDDTIEMLNDGEYESPTEFQDLEIGLIQVHYAYLRMRRVKDVPEEVFDNFERWMLHAKAIVDAKKAGMVPTAAEQALPPGMAPPMGPPGMMGPPPGPPGMVPPMGPPGMMPPGPPVQ